jgi:hypothetical protein
MKTLALAFALFLSTGGSALAADTTFGTGSLLHSGSVVVTCLCAIHNAGTKPVTIRSVGIPPYTVGNTSQPAISDSCTTAPLAPDNTCRFSTSLGVYGGGIAKVKGSTKNLRGECTLIDNASGLSVMTVPMR